ncbi:MAG: hypothetical protein LBH16_08990 [Treponema sp.]|nr:hypothetical protein [Treponema sp.]
MKNLKYILLYVVLAVSFFSCNNPIGLGSMLDIDGPEIEFTSPSSRKAVPVEFEITGTVLDESPIQKILLTTSANNTDFAKQWRFLNNIWEVSEDGGGSWSRIQNAQWNGNNRSANWMIPVDMRVNGGEPADGEYLFLIQAWDNGGNSDANSIKSLVLIIDRDPPRVEITNPYIHSRYSYYDSEQGIFTNNNTLQELHAYPDNSDARFEPANIGKFLTQGFQLQWQIDDNHDVWSIDIRFYRYDVIIDGYPETPLPDNYIYRYNRNLPPPPVIPVPADNLRPSGTVNVPALTSPAGIYDEGGILENPIIDNEEGGKTTIKITASCYDAAGNPNQEKTLGYFIYWPKADKAWIIYSSGMEKPEEYADMSENELKENSFMIYPGRNIKATAFHAQGISKVIFSLHNYNEKEPDFQNRISDPIPLGYMENFESSVEFTNAGKTQVVRRNDPRFGNILSTIFPWEFRPPNRTGYYVVKAAAYDSNENPGDEWQSLFMVQDITYPDFTVQPSPVATEQLFMHIDNSDKSITISGSLSDATEITSLTMVWINPESRNFAAMSQLQYFRDPDYAGWEQAKNLQSGSSAGEIKNASLYGENFPYDEAKPNRLWNLALTHLGEDEDTNRQVYNYSQKIILPVELNIDVGMQPLKSQIFLLRAENPNDKTTIITYAPQGDTLPPEIIINNVTIKRGASNLAECIPGEYSLIPKFVDNDQIVITGSWKEDSTQYLNVQTYLYPSIKISVNGNLLSTGTDDILPAAGNHTQGTFEITGTFGGSGPLLTTAIKDTLVVNAVIEDIGGNPAEFGASWLIESDALRFLRISSSDQDKAYKAGDIIELFLEFSKPVTLNKGTAKDPVLLLNTGGRAYYGKKDDTNQNTENSRQYFIYTVGPDHDTTNLPDKKFLNVTGLSVDEGASDGDTGWNTDNYPFRWQFKQLIDGVEVTESMRIVLQNTYNGLNDSEKTVIAPLPVASDNISSLIAGKEITIDTTAPLVSGVTANPTGWHGAGKEIFITVSFNKPVKIDSASANLPYLNLNTGGRTSGNAEDVRLNNNTITFKYTVQSGDNVANLNITGYGGTITDIPGTALAAFTHPVSGVSLDTTIPGSPSIQIYKGTGISGTLINPVPVNLYDNAVYIQINANGKINRDYDRIEYTTNGGVSWVTSKTQPEVMQPDEAQPERIQLTNSGSYTVRARQIDSAGNVSNASSNIIFNWDPGNLVTRIDSTTPNGTYSDITATKNINITVHFRKPLVFTASDTKQITLNVNRGGTIGIPINSADTSTVASPADRMTFSYSIASNDNCADLDVTALNITATDVQGVQVSSLIVLPETANRLGTIKDIVITTGALALAGGVTAPTWASTQTSANLRAADAWTGTISLRFNRAVSKGSGNVTITQKTTAADNTTNVYRLPAVLTDAQSAKYKSARNFNAFYTRGTNGSASGTADTSTKWILRYDQTTVVTPNNTGTDIQQLAFDFHQAETVTIPVSSEEITVSGTGNDTLTIRIQGSNALAVLGATYQITYDANIVQDSLGYRWPSSAQQYSNGTTPNSGGTVEINRPFIRIDKRINEDRITGNIDGSLSKPHLGANYSRVLTTTARLDCRTPNSVVRYTGAGTEYTATGVTGLGGWTMSSGTASNWVNNTSANDGTDNNNISAMPAQPTLAAETGGTVYDNFTGTGNATLIPIGTTNEQGYIWRVSARSRNGSSGTTNSDQYEEMAFRTVLTYQLDGMPSLNGTYGQNPKSGDQLWIRGGDAISSSSVPGFPLTWDDDFARLSAETRRAGVRLMEWKSPAPATTTFTQTAAPAANTNQYTAPTGTTIGASDSVLTARVGTTNYFLRVISNTNRTFRLYNTDNEDAFAATAVNGIGLGSNISVTIYSTPMCTTSEWKYVTWEINVRTWFDVVLGRGVNMTTAQDAANAWQYGPRQTAYQRGGWSAAKDNYTLYPGKHRWVRITNGQYQNGTVNFSYLFNPRDNPASVTLNQPSP